MLTIPKAARGKTVYGTGSYAPNTGRVSAQGIQGYVAREQRKLPKGLSKVGADGYSDTRSGLAAKALRGQNRPAHWNAGQQGNQGSGGQWHQVNHPNSPNTTGGTNGGGAGAGAVQASLPQQVVVNDAGTLQLPYDDQWSQDIIGAMGDYNSELLSLQQEQQQQALEYMNQSGNLNRGYDQTKRDTLNLGAGSGAAFSSAYGSTVAKNAMNYQNDRNELDAENNSFNQNANQQRLAIQQAFQEMLRQDALARASSAAEDAGSLGYGQSTGGRGKTKDKDKGKDKKDKPKSKPGGYHTAQAKRAMKGKR